MRNYSREHGRDSGTRSRRSLFSAARNPYAYEGFDDATVEELERVGEKLQSLGKEFEYAFRDWKGDYDILGTAADRMGVYFRAGEIGDLESAVDYVAAFEDFCKAGIDLLTRYMNKADNFIGAIYSLTGDPDRYPYTPGEDYV